MEGFLLKKKESLLLVVVRTCFCDGTYNWMTDPEKT
jgi:hypothetical protein